MKFYEFEAKRLLAKQGVRLPDGGTRALTPSPSPARRARGAVGALPPQQLPRASAELQQAARDLRQGQTKSEAILWKALRNRGANGLKFRRQHPVGAFIIDFYCHEHALAVEIDGPIHDYSQTADAERQAALESLGLRFVQIPAETVERDVEAAIALINAAVSAHPSPSGRGAWGEV